MTTLEIADTIGLLSFALSGFLIAVHYKLDLLGVFISSFLTALGGGVVRDVLANKTPYVFTNYSPILLVLATILVSILFKLHKINNLEGKTTFIISDAIGLSSFAITGSLIAIQSGFNFVGVLILAFLTAVGGGTIRDILINRVPSILVSEFYGSVAIIIGALIYLLHVSNNLFMSPIILVFFMGLALRLLAHYKSWSLPKL